MNSFGCKEINLSGGNPHLHIFSRVAITDNLRPVILLDLQQSVHVHNIYVRELKPA